MEIVDTQFHIGRGAVDQTLVAMNALGIRSLLADEFWDGRASQDATHIRASPSRTDRGERSTPPLKRQPTCIRIAPPTSSGLTGAILSLSVMRLAATAPHARAFRLQPVWTAQEAAEFQRGSYNQLFDIAQDVSIPVFIFLPGYADVLARYASRYPKLWFIIDHCGMGFGNVISHMSTEDKERTSRLEYFHVVLRAAEYPNVALKWSHAHDLFGAHEYPFKRLSPILRRALDAFGPERIMWASDSSVIPEPIWGDMLYPLKSDPELTDEERRWILGASAWRILRWPTSNEG